MVIYQTPIINKTYANQSCILVVLLNTSAYSKPMLVHGNCRKKDGWCVEHSRNPLLITDKVSKLGLMLTITEIPAKLADLLHFQISPAQHKQWFIQIFKLRLFTNPLALHYSKSLFAAIMFQTASFLSYHSQAAPLYQQVWQQRKAFIISIMVIQPLKISTRKRASAANILTGETWITYSHRNFLARHRFPIKTCH